MDKSITKAFVRHYPDIGQTTAYVEWSDGSLTEGPPNGVRMRALLVQAKHNGVLTEDEVCENWRSKGTMSYGNDRTEVIFRKDYVHGYQCILSSRFGADDRARFAMELMSRHPGITAQENGEDSAGRQALKRDTPQEIAAYCCDLARCAFEEFEARGWSFPLPPHEEVKTLAREEN
jgi:hypothetical protein